MKIEVKELKMPKINKPNDFSSYPIKQFTCLKEKWFAESSFSRFLTNPHSFETQPLLGHHSRQAQSVQAPQHPPAIQPRAPAKATADSCGCVW